MSIDHHKHAAIADMESIWGGFQVRARASLGVESFGLGVTQVPPNFDQMPPHTHDFDGQEEVYMALRGNGSIVFGDGTSIDLTPDTAVRVGPSVSRKLAAGPDGLQVLVAGGTPGKPYPVLGHSELGAEQPNPVELPGVKAAAGGAGTDSDDYSAVVYDEMTEFVYRGERNTFHAVGKALGTQSFGVGVVDLKAPEGENPYPLHDHASDGQTEVFAVVSGSGSMLLGDDSIELKPGELVAVAPEVKRQLTGGPDGLRVIAVGA